MSENAPKGVPFFVMPGNALRSLRDELLIDLGDDRTGELMYRFGYRCGENMTRELDLHSSTMEDLKDSLAILVLESGLGRADANIEDGGLRLVFLECMESALGGKKDWCHFTKGYLAGLASSLLDSEYVCSETECVSQKKKRCVFTITKGPGEVVPKLEKAAKIVDAKKEIEISIKLEDGGSYLLQEETPKKSYEVFVGYVKGGYDGLCVTREYPEKIRKQYSLKSTPILWLTRTGKEGCIGPEKLSELYHKIGNFLNSSKKSIVLLSGLEYLISQNSFASVLKFVQLLRDQIAIHNAILIAPISPLTVEERELKLIEREFEVVRL